MLINTHNDRFGVVNLVSVQSISVIPVFTLGKVHAVFLAQGLDLLRGESDILGELRGIQYGILPEIIKLGLHLIPYHRKYTCDICQRNGRTQSITFKKSV